jgi:hypothetical protein
MVVPTGIFASALQTFALEGCAADAPFDRAEAAEVAIEIGRQRRTDRMRRAAVFPADRAKLPPQELPHARLKILPVERAQRAIGVGHEQRRADRRFQPIDEERLASRRNARLSRFGSHHHANPETAGRFVVSSCAC